MTSVNNIKNILEGTHHLLNLNQSHDTLKPFKGYVTTKSIVQNKAGRKYNYAVLYKNKILNSSALLLQ